MNAKKIQTSQFDRAAEQVDMTVDEPRHYRSTLGVYDMRVGSGEVAHRCVRSDCCDDTLRHGQRGRVVGRGVIKGYQGAIQNDDFGV